MHFVHPALFSKLLKIPCISDKTIDFILYSYIYLLCSYI